MKAKVTQSCLTLYDPTGYTVHGILQARILEWVAVPFLQEIFPTQGSNPGLLNCRRILYQLSHKGCKPNFYMHWETKIPVTHFIAIFTLFQWSGTKPALSSTCTYTVGWSSYP